MFEVITEANEGGYTCCVGTYYAGTLATITAFPDQCFAFKN